LIDVRPNGAVAVVTSTRRGLNAPDMEALTELRDRLLEAGDDASARGRGHGRGGDVVCRRRGHRRDATSAALW
jgi:hypothetical protein